MQALLFLMALLLPSGAGAETTVTLGAHDVYKTVSTQQKIKVEKQIVHPNYNFSSKLHDIMLLKVP